MVIIFLFLSIIFILFNSIGVIVFLPKGKPIRNYLMDTSISYGGTMGLIFGLLAAISQATTSEKILSIIISSIWGTISGLIGSFWIKNKS
jgi:hypothetical protein